MGCPANLVLKDAATSPRAVQFSDAEKQLLNDFQRDFPLTHSPFDLMATRLGITEDEVITTLLRFQQEGLVSRVGPVFSPNRIGKSTLAAMAVPEERLEEVAALVSSFDEVNHNYEREHRFNLWFVATAQNQGQLDSVLEDIESRCGIAVMSLPMLDSYHIDLGFSIDWDHPHGGQTAGKQRHTGEPEQLQGKLQRSNSGSVITSEIDQQLIAIIQKGMPLVKHPFTVIAERIGVDESIVLERLRLWLEDGTINRIGVVVRHRELGYQANAMVVWDISDEHVAQIGHCFSKFDFVTLCYRRPRHLPQWRYNLFCMIHGQDRDAVMEHVAMLVRQCGEEPVPYRVLFSQRCFKQRGARYQKASSASSLLSSFDGAAQR
jgi:DNA-binding Lrp family transcriptional regulator